MLFKRGSLYIQRHKCIEIQRMEKYIIHKYNQKGVGVDILKSEKIRLNFLEKLLQGTKKDLYCDK